MKPRSLVAAIVLVSLGAACTRHDATTARLDAARLPARPTPPVGTPGDVHIHSLEVYTAAHADDWLDREALAGAYLSRARAFDDWEDYARAERTLDEAFHIAPAGSGPFLTRAVLNFTLHRLARIEPDLVATERGLSLTGGQTETIESLRVDTAYYQGRYDVARAGYERHLAAQRSVANLVALAQLDWKTGDFAAAEALLNEAARTASDPAYRGFVALAQTQMELDRGRWPEALAHARDGLAASPDDHHLKERSLVIRVLMGDAAGALPDALTLIAHTGLPEVMDLVASIYVARGDRTSAEPWITRARAEYDDRLARFPEAVAAHALDHFLRFDPNAAPRIAEINAQARPGGEAQVKLAEAYARVGRTADARRVLEATLATAWNTADLHATAARVFLDAGDTGRAATEQARALALDPHAMELIAIVLPPHA